MTTKNFDNLVAQISKLQPFLMATYTPEFYDWMNQLSRREAQCIKNFSRYFKELLKEHEVLNKYTNALYDLVKCNFTASMKSFLRHNPEIGMFLEQHLNFLEKAAQQFKKERTPQILKRKSIGEPMAMEEHFAKKQQMWHSSELNSKSSQVPPHQFIDVFLLGFLSSHNLHLESVNLETDFPLVFKLIACLEAISNELKDHENQCAPREYVLMKAHEQLNQILDISKKHAEPLIVDFNESLQKLITFLTFVINKPAPSKDHSSYNMQLT